jgi:hypothetical protein
MKPAAARDQTRFPSFCLGRMVGKIGLKRIGATSNLAMAKQRIAALSAAWPGDYVVFDVATGHIVARTSTTG